MQEEIKTRKAPKKKVEAPESGDTMYVMALRGNTMAGSFSHVAEYAKIYKSKEACQTAIDTMPGWLGMPERSKYFPLALTLA